MIAYVKGTVVSIEEDHCIIEVGSIGYNVNISSRTASMIPNVGEFVQIFTYTAVREDAFLLYGFLRQEELSLFRLLLTVNGIGPKGALGILSAIGEQELKLAIVAQDDKLLAKAPGIGMKTAQRLILELKHKISLEEPALSAHGNFQVKDQSDVMEALLGLGYSSSEIVKGLQQVEDSMSYTTEELLKLVLKKLIH